MIGLLQSTTQAVSGARGGLYASLGLAQATHVVHHVVEILALNSTISTYLNISQLNVVHVVHTSNHVHHCQ